MLFWRGLDIRWLRHSYANGAVGEALRKLKQSIARGEGRLRFISIDGGRQKRSRRAVEAAEKRDNLHPVQALLTS